LLLAFLPLFLRVGIKGVLGEADHYIVEEDFSEHVFEADECGLQLLVEPGVL
jgi:hypothetical protein